MTSLDLAVKLSRASYPFSASGTNYIGLDAGNSLELGNTQGTKLFQQQRVKSPSFLFSHIGTTVTRPPYHAHPPSSIRVPKMQSIQQIVLLGPGMTCTTHTLPSLRRLWRLPIHPCPTLSHPYLHRPSHLNERRKRRIHWCISVSFLLRFPSLR